VVGELPTVDVVTISRHFRPQTINAYLNVTPIKDLVIQTPGPEATDGRGRSSQIFLVDVVARGGETRATARGRTFTRSRRRLSRKRPSASSMVAARAGIAPPADFRGQFLRASLPNSPLKSPKSGASGETFHHT
jgi:hypothetical protein